MEKLFDFLFFIFGAFFLIRNLLSLGEFLSLVDDDGKSAGKEKAGVDPGKNVNPSQGELIVAIVAAESTGGVEDEDNDEEDDGAEKSSDGDFVETEFGSGDGGANADTQQHEG